MGGGGDEPVSKPGNTFEEIASRFEFRVSQSSDGDVGKGMADESTQVLGEGPEGVIPALCRKESVSCGATG